MKASSISSSAMSQVLRQQVQRMQTELIKAEKEIATFRVADTGLHLGIRTGQSVSLDRDIQRLENIKDTNGLVATRLSASQDALGQVQGAGQQMLSTLTTMLNGSLDSGVAFAQSKSALSTMNSVLNATVSGGYIFAGTNTDLKPFADFTDPNSTSRRAFDALFFDEFGYAIDDPATASIDGAQITAFLTRVEDIYVNDVPWDDGMGNTFAWSDQSSASDQTITSRIALNETAQTSVSANEQGIRKLAMAASTVFALMDGNLNADATRALTEKAVTMAGQAIGDLTSTRAAVGVIENRVTGANDRLTVQVDLFSRMQLDMTGIDEFETSTRITSLMAQIETSYALTSRFQQLSLLKFIT